MTTKMAKQPDKSQSQRERFIKSAKELGCETSEAAFDTALKRVGKSEKIENRYLEKSEK
jgi:hypothetical protein